MDGQQPTFDPMECYFDACRRVAESNAAVARVNADAALMEYIFRVATDMLALQSRLTIERLFFGPMPSDPTS